VDTFIRNENLKLYRRALAESTDERQRRVLLGLLKLLGEEKSSAVPDSNVPPNGMPVDIPSR
jgi:hypothetical protein